MTEWRNRLGMNPEPPGSPFPPPVFVAGCMRSGTTFLVDKLSQHPQLLKVGNELRSVWTTLGDASCIGANSEAKSADQAHYEAANNMTHYFSEFIRESQTPRRYLMRSKNYFRHKIGRVSYDWNRVRPLNKSTQLVNKLTYVHQLFPNSQVILIVRGVEGHAASMKSFILHNYEREGIVHVYPREKDSGWIRLPKSDVDPDIPSNLQYPGSFETIPSMWLQLNLRALTDLESLNPDHFRVVVYEELVQQQNAMLGKLFSFLNLSPDHHAEEERIAQQTLGYYNTSTTGDPLSKWKDQLTDGELDEIDRLKASPEYAQLQELLGAMKLRT